MKFVDKTNKLDWFSLIILIPVLFSIANFILRIVNGTPLPENIITACATILMAIGLLLYYWARISTSIPLLSISLALFIMQAILFNARLVRNTTFWGLCAILLYISINELILKRNRRRPPSSNQ
jgi:predicted membrane protein